jgi:hypothetical protein
MSKKKKTKPEKTDAERAAEAERAYAAALERCGFGGIGEEEPVYAPDLDTSQVVSDDAGGDTDPG